MLLFFFVGVAADDELGREGAVRPFAYVKSGKILNMYDLGSTGLIW